MAAYGLTSAFDLFVKHHYDEEVSRIAHMHAGVETSIYGAKSHDGVFEG